MRLRTTSPVYLITPNRYYSCSASPPELTTTIKIGQPLRNIYTRSSTSEQLTNQTDPMKITENQLALAHHVNQTLAKASEATGLLRLLLLKGVLIKLILEAGEPRLRDGVEELEAATREMAIGDRSCLTYF